MHRQRPTLAVLAFLVASAAALQDARAGGRSPGVPDDPRDVPVARQLTATRMRADVDGDGVAEQVILVALMTSARSAAQGTEVILGVARPDEGGQRGKLLWARHVAAETGQPAHDAEVSTVDLDGDGTSEVVLTWDRSLSATVRDRSGEVLSFKDPLVARTLWTGLWEHDTRRDLKTPAETREWLRTEIDFAATRKAAGKALVLRHVAAMKNGRELAPPTVSIESLPVSLR